MLHKDVHRNGEPHEIGRSWAANPTQAGASKHAICTSVERLIICDRNITPRPTSVFSLSISESNGVKEADQLDHSWTGSRRPASVVN